MTAVEWFIEQLPIRIVNSYQEEIAKAKQMEQDQLMDKYGEGYDEGLYDGMNK